MFLKIKCSNCGSPFELKSETDFVICPYCSSTLYLKYNTAIKYFFFSPAITEQRAEATLLETLKRIGIENPQFLSRKKILFPFLRKGDLTEVTPLFNPHPSFFSSIKLSSHTPLFFSDKAKDFGDVFLIDEETFLLCKNDETDNLSIYHIPFYEFTIGTEENKLKFYIEATEGKIFFEGIPSSISKKQVNRVLSFLFLYFVFFALLSFLVKPPALSFFITLAISVAVSPFVTGFVLRKYGQ